MDTWHNGISGRGLGSDGKVQEAPAWASLDHGELVAEMLFFSGGQDFGMATWGRGRFALVLSGMAWHGMNGCGWVGGQHEGWL